MMCRRIFIAAVCASVISFPTLGCHSAGTPSGTTDDRPLVVATIPMIGDLAREIAGDALNVVTLLSEGVDPHTYQPLAPDIRKLSEADVVLYNGLLLEGGFESDLQKLASRNPNVIAVGETVPEALLRTPPDFAGHPDPHLWMDVGLWAETVPAIRDALIAVAPEHEPAMTANADSLAKKLALLDEYVLSAIASVPAQQRYLVTAHDAFGYFAEAYGIAVASVQGVSTESEAGLDDVQNLVDLLVEKRIPAVFFEASVTNRNVSAVMAGAEVAGHKVVVGGELYSDSAGPPGTWEATYFGMIDHNVRTLVTSLGGQVPEGGFRAVLSDFNASGESAEAPAAAAEN